MLLTLMAFLAGLAGSSLALPLGLNFLASADPFAADSLDFYAGPYSPDFYGGGLALDLGLSWPLSRYGASWFDSGDFLNPAAAAGFYYPGNSRTVNRASENFVRGDVFGGTEVGVRDEVSVRNGYGYGLAPFLRSRNLPGFYRRPFSYAFRR